MLRFLLFRLLATIPMLLFLSVLVFLLVHLIPGDAAEAIVGDTGIASAEQIDLIRTQLGLNLPLHEQYISYMSEVVRGDFGVSLFGARPVSDAVIARFPATLSLTLAATLLAIVIGLAAGVAGAMRPGRWLDRISMLGASLGLAIPNFWLGLVLLSAFAVTLSWFPATGYVPLSESPWAWARGIVLPAIALGTAASAVIARQMRSALADALQSNYVRTARAKGVSWRTVVLKHALKNAAMPVVTVTGLTVASLLGGSVIVEQVFGIPGLGDLAITAVRRRDIPVIQGVVLFTALIVLITNLMVDIAYGMLNPKVRTS